LIKFSERKTALAAMSLLAIANVFRERR